MLRKIVAIVLILMSSPGSADLLATVGVSGDAVVSRTPCGAGQLDYSLSTGCNVIFYVNGISSP
jgi:hypothetical protein